MLQPGFWETKNLLDRVRIPAGKLSLAWIGSAVVLTQSIYPALADDRPFVPVRTLTSWYTDRRPIDVEIVASSGIANEINFIEPRQSLKLRLERAYLDDIGWNAKPAHSSAAISFDTVTGLPRSLFVAPPQQVEERGDNIVPLTHEESVRRTLNLRIDGHSSARTLRATSEKLDRCRGVQEGDGLFRFAGNASGYCRLADARPRSTHYVAVLAGGESIKLTCNDLPIGCRMSFPFESFAPVVGFHRSRLSEWRKIIETATAFLNSKKYRQQENGANGE